MMSQSQALEQLRSISEDLYIGAIQVWIVKHLLYFIWLTSLNLKY